MSTLEKSLSIIELLAVKPGGMSVSSIAQTVNQPASGVHRTLNELMRLGYVRQVQDQGDYALSMKLAAMGVGFIGACVLLGPLFGLSPLSGRAWTLLGVFAAATPALMCLFVFLVSRVKQRLRRSQRAKHAAGLSATLS